MTKKNLVAMVVLIALSALCARLGVWQLGRAQERLAIGQEIHEGRSQPRLNLNTSPSETHNWQPSSASGYWRPDLTVLLENRNHQGRPGYWVGTPLVLEPDSSEAVLVLRGWLERTPSSTPQLPPPSVDDPVTVQGELRSHVPRMYELTNLWGPEAETLASSLPTPDGQPPIVQNLALTDLQQATGLTLRPYVLLLHESLPSENPNLIQDWPHPNLDAHQNRGYAIQWFGFATIAGVAAIVLLWRSRRFKKLSRDSNA